MVSAALRAINLESEVMKTRTEEASRLSRKYVTSNACSPFSFQVGDCLAWLYELQERGIDPNTRASVFQPMAKGPCRFGQYYVLLRGFIDDIGFKGAGILSPDSDKDYSNIPINSDDMSRLIRIYFKGTFCNDLLEDSLLRVRPYEKVPGSAERLYRELAPELVSLVEKGADSKKLANFMKEAAPRFIELIDRSIKRKPLVVMNGEIFVRSHPEANQQSIKLLEKYGLEVKLASLNQWFEYTNKKSIRQYRKARDWKNLLKASIKRQYMRVTGKKLAAPFRKLLEGREGHNTDHMISCAQDALIYDKLITGESPLTIGEAHLFTKGKLHGISGIYHVGPFGCMHETAATSQIQSLTQKQRAEATSIHDRIIPFMDAVFGDSELSNLEAEIAAFAEKCYIKQEISIKENQH
jgi:predicted nucleotide-binding protein (sugar kinase/HSP70/actin superfamily)